MFNHPFHPIFIDTEFMSFEHPNLISFGACTRTPDGSERTFYREISDPTQPHLCSTFVLQNIIPLLEGGEAFATSHQSLLSFFEFAHTISVETGKPILLVSDAPQWENRVLSGWLARHEMQFPAFIRPLVWFFQLKRLNDLPDFTEADFAQALGHPFRQHHALDDARVNLHVFSVTSGDFCP
jgi:hypothetical protein